MKKKQPQIPKANDVIEITARRCSDKVQPLFSVGSRFIVQSVDTMADGMPVVVVVHPRRKKATLRANAQRFDWKIITKEDLLEEKFKKECKESSKQLASEFSIKEQLNIAFVPLIFNHIAWFYGNKARRLAADYRISVLKKLCRAFDHVRTEYERELQKDLDRNHIKHIESQTEMFMREYALNFTQYYYTINNAFKKKMPDYPYDDLMTYAIMGMLMIKQVDIHNRRMDALIKERLGNANNSIRMPIMDKLYTILDAYAGEVGKFDYSDFNVQNCIKVIENKVNEIEFDIL